MFRDEVDENPPQTAAAVKAELAAKKARTDAVRTFEIEKSKSGVNSSLITAESMMDDAAAEAEVDGTTRNPALVTTPEEAERLNELWARVRLFLNGKDESGNDVEHSTPGRVRFTEICELQAARNRKSAPGILPFDTVVQAFITSRMQPELSNAEFRKVFNAIEAFHDEKLNLVNWRAILSAPVQRET